MGISKIDIADYLESKEMITKYLNTVLKEGNNAGLVNAIEQIDKTVKKHNLLMATNYEYPPLK